ncbi:LacI family DNA-binding transcriptional regulator [Micromonospora sp. M12]
MATLSDVARRAGVSPATASRVINGSSKPVTDELRERCSPPSPSCSTCRTPTPNCWPARTAARWA